MASSCWKSVLDSFSSSTWIIDGGLYWSFPSSDPLGERSCCSVFSEDISEDRCFSLPEQVNQIGGYIQVFIPQCNQSVTLVSLPTFRPLSSALLMFCHSVLEQLLVISGSKGFSKSLRSGPPRAMRPRAASSAVRSRGHTTARAVAAGLPFTGSSPSPPIFRPRGGGARPARTQGREAR